MLSRLFGAAVVSLIGASTSAIAIESNLEGQAGPHDWSGFYAGVSIGGGVGANRLSPQKSPIQRSTNSVILPGSCSSNPNGPTYVLTPEQQAGLTQGIVVPSLFSAIGYTPLLTTGNITSYGLQQNNTLINVVYPNGSCFTLFDVSDRGDGIVRYNDSGPTGTYVQGPGTTTSTSTTALTGPLAGAQGVDAATLSALATLPGQRHDIRTSGVIGGGQVGYNYRLGNVLVGFEADINGSGLEGRYRLGGFTARSGIDWFGTVRGRVGYTWDNLLVYGTGGFAFGDVSLAYILTTASVNDTKTQIGWVAGAGAEYALSARWSLKVEYKHIDLGSSTFLRQAGYDARVTAVADTGMVGLNYRW